jgi:hypothetical protein
LQSLATVEDGCIKIYNLPLSAESQLSKMKPVEVIDIGDKFIELNLIRWMPFGEFNLIAASDFLSNVFLFKNGTLFKTYLNIHSKLITDITWFFTIDERSFGS